MNWREESTRSVDSTSIRIDSTHCPMMYSVASIRAASDSADRMEARKSRTGSPMRS